MKVRLGVRLKVRVSVRARVRVRVLRLPLLRTLLSLVRHELLRARLELLHLALDLG